MDIVAAVQKGAASFTDISLPEPKRLPDYGIWGREVLSIGDGVVAGIGDKFPEERMSDPVLFGKPGYTSGLLKELLPLIGWTNTVAGNYVIVDHENGEFSMYAHLQEGSILVKAGESVKKGQVVGKVGNTGNSGAPHLHFQLMDLWRTFSRANGLSRHVRERAERRDNQRVPGGGELPGVQRQHLHGDTVKAGE